MKRKIIKQGIGGYTIHLPKKWCEEHNITWGDEIDVTEIGRDLLFSTETQTQKKEITTTIDSEEESFIRVSLNDLYRLGYDRVKIQFKSDKTKHIIASIVDKFLFGFEVTEKSTKYIIIENITEPSSEKQHVLLRRMFLLIKESFEVIANNKDLKELQELTQKVGQYDNFCRRNISKRKFMEERENFYWALYNYLLLIQHSLLHLYENTTKISKEGKTLFSALQSAFDELYQAFFKKDISVIQFSTTQNKNLLYQNTYSLLKKKSTDAIFIYHCGELARLLYLAAAPMLGILMH